MANESLSAAKAAKNDEFYTQYKMNQRDLTFLICFSVCRNAL